MTLPRPESTTRVLVQLPSGPDIETVAGVSFLAPLKIGGGVSVFGIRFHLATDDFFLPSVLGSFCRFILLSYYVGVHVYASISSGAPVNGTSTLNDSNSLEDEVTPFDPLLPELYPCMYDHHLLWFMLGNIIILAINIIILQMLACNSRKGVIWHESRPLYQDSHPRKWVLPLLYVSLVGHILEISVLFAGTYFLITAYLNPECTALPNYPLYLFTLGISMEYLGLIVIFVVLWLLTKDKCCPLLRTKERTNRSRGIFYSLFSSICFGQSKASFFDDAADLFDDVFPDDKFVPTDILAALVLIYAHEDLRQSRQRRLLLASAAASTPGDNTEGEITATRVNLNFSRQFSIFPEWQNPQKLYRFMQYSAAIYGYKMYIMESETPWKSLKDLNRHTVCCSCCCCCIFPCCCRPRPNVAEFADQDNCCMCDIAAIKATLPFLDEDDIVYASFQNGFLETPFLVAIDRETQSVVVAVRGTLSIADVITDLVAKPRDFASEIPSSEFISGSYQDRLIEAVSGFSCHSGMREAALFVYKQLQEKHLLEKAFSRCPDYRLVITGHSLGAGTATILAFLLRLKYPNLLCYSYGPPGGLLCAEAAETSKEFCASVIVGADIIPRTTIKAIHDLRAQMVEVLRDSHISKFNILSQGLLGRCCGGTSEGDWIRRIEEDYTRIKDRHRSSTDESTDPILTTADQYGATETSPRQYVAMYPPGEIIYFEKAITDDRSLVNVVRKSQSDFSEILVTPSMIADHMPASYLQTLEHSLAC